nr:hypothetical protein Q903MT_gene1772 [Picea sitchensis]
MNPQGRITYGMALLSNSQPNSQIPQIMNFLLLNHNNPTQPTTPPLTTIALGQADLETPRAYTKLTTKRMNPLIDYCFPI